MAIKRSFALALLGVLTIAAVAPVNAQNPPPARPRRTTTPRPPRTERMQGNTNSGMTGGRRVPVSTANNTAVVAGNIDNAKKTLDGMVALLDQIEARKK